MPDTDRIVAAGWSGGALRAGRDAQSQETAAWGGGDSSGNLFVSPDHRTHKHAGSVVDEDALKIALFQRPESGQQVKVVAPRVL